MVCTITNILSRIDFTEIATVVMAIFTGCLWCSTRKLWKMTEKSIKLGRDEFIATHPPKLRVHSVFLEKGTDPPIIGSKNKVWNIQCFVDNIGGSTAIIKERNLTFKKIENPMPPLLDFDKSILIEKTLASGEGTIESLIIDDNVVNILRLYETQLGGGSQMSNTNLYFFGYIDYQDNIKTMRRIAFCRQFNIKTKRFTKVEDEDYEYSY
jgi:hypothetical protein